MAQVALEGQVLAETARARRAPRRDGAKPWQYLAPTLIVFGLFVYPPIWRSLWLSLHRAAPFGIETSR